VTNPVATVVTDRNRSKTALDAVLPETAKKADTENNTFKSKVVIPKGAMRGLCAKAVDKVIRQKQTLAEATKTLVQSEREYVILVLSEYQEWLVSQGAVPTSPVVAEQA
jgi:hypothetical protein